MLSPERIGDFRGEAIEARFLRRDLTSEQIFRRALLTACHFHPVVNVLSEVSVTGSLDVERPWSRDARCGS